MLLRDPDAASWTLRWSEKGLDLARRAKPSDGLEPLTLKGFLFGLPCGMLARASAEGVSGAMGAGVEDDGGEGASAAGHGGRGVMGGRDAVEWGE